MVFILVPGGSFLTGAQEEDPDGPNYDEFAEPTASPPHEITLAPFFMARHEITQAQWLRLRDGKNPSYYGLPWGRLFKSHLRPGPVTPAHPVEEVVCGPALAGAAQDREQVHESISSEGKESRPGEP